MSTPHTPEPWAWECVAEKSNEWAVGQAWREDGTPISGQIEEGEWVEDVVIERRLVGMNESGHANPADAVRIVACVNACTGMADPEATITALVAALDRFVKAADAKTLVAFDDPMEATAASVVEQARAALKLAGEQP